MNGDCYSCIFEYYESDTNYRTCKHPDYDEDNPDHCPGSYLIEDAKADEKERNS